MSRKENKNKSKFSLGIIDIIIFICVAAGIAAAFRFAMIPDTQIKGQEELTFVLEIQNVDKDFADGVKTGEKIYENLKGVYIGDITDVSKTPYKEPAVDLTTLTRKMSPIEGRYNVYVTVSTYADVSPGTTLVNDIEVQVGKKMFVRAKSFAAGCFCVEMDFGGEKS